MFKKAGLRTINLYNEFNDSVAFRGADDFVFPAKKMGNKWVIDTTFVVDVYDSIKPNILIRQNNVEVSHTSSTDVITVEAGSTLEFVDITAQGRPNTRSWRIGGDVVSTDSLAVIQFNKLGNFKGNFRASRTGLDIPNASGFYNIAATFEVIPSSLPFEVSGDVIELEDQTIIVPFNGEFSPFSNQEQFFTVNVAGVGDMNIESITINPNNATQLAIKLTDPIYKNDVITVSYDGNGTLESTDTRTPLAFTDLPVSMFQHIAKHYDFEGSSALNWVSALGWQNNDTNSLAVITDELTPGNKALKIVGGVADQWSAQMNITDLFSLEAGAEYEFQISYYGAADVGAALRPINPWLGRPNAAGTAFTSGGNNGRQWGIAWHNGSRPNALETWHTVKHSAIFTSTGFDNHGFMIRHREGGTLYFDDIIISKVDNR